MVEISLWGQGLDQGTGRPKHPLSMSFKVQLAKQLAPAVDYA